MQRAHALALSVRLASVWLLAAPSAGAATSAPASVLLFGQDLVHPKQPVPDDPLAGLPTDGNRGDHKGNSAGKSACALGASAANERDIGDLRATLAFVKHGPRSWPCPARTAQNALRLRITIDGSGKITTFETVSGDSSLANAMAKRLPGRVIDARGDGPTTGIVVVTFATKGP